MAVISYGYDAWSSAGANWFDMNLAVDGAINDLWAYYSQKETWTTKLRVSETTAPGTNLGTITKVEIGVNWYILGGGENVFPYMQPEGGSAVAVPYVGPFEVFVTDYIDVTGNGYGWADFPTLYIDWYSYCPEPDLYYNGISIDWVWLRITYDEAPTGLDLKVHGQSWADIAKIHGVAEGDIATVHGAS